MPPAAKSGRSIQTSKSTRVKAREHNRRVAAPAPVPQPVDVIVLTSSDDEDVPIVLSSISGKRKRDASPRAKAALWQEVEARFAESPVESSTVIELRRQVEALTKEREELKSAKSRLELSARTPSALKSVISELDDCVSCEICTMKMWSPVTIVTCGHSFCEKCLHGWFTTIYDQHVAAHPDFLGPLFIPDALYQRRDRPEVRATIRRMEELRPKPTYTCPTCRVAVKQRPVEVFAIKEIVHRVAKMAGEEVEVPTTMKNKAIGSMFDGFFKKK